MTDPETATIPRRRMPSRGIRALLWLFVLPFLLLFVAGIAVLDRDITAPAWVRDRVESRAAEVLGGGTLHFGDIYLRVGRDLHPQIWLMDTVLRDGRGQVLAEVDRIAAGLSPRGVLFERAALVQRIALTGTQVSVRRDADGAFQFGFDRPGGNGALLADGLGGLVAQLDGLRERPAFAALEGVTLDGVAMTYRDARADRVWTVDDGRFDLRLTAARTTAALAVALAGDAGTAQVDLALDSPRDSLAADISVSVRDLPARDLASQSAALAVLDALDAPVSAQLTTALDADGVLAPLAVTLSVGAGEITGGPVPLPVDSATIVGRYDPEAQRVAVDALSLASASTRFTAQGHVLLQDFRAGLPRSFVMQLVATEIALNPRGVYDEPLPLARADIDMRLRLAPFRLDIGQVTVTDPAITAQAAMTVAATAQGWTSRLDIAADRLTPEALMRVWPEQVRPGTRRWIANNIDGGTLQDVNLGLRLLPEAAPVLAASFGFEGARVRYLRDNPWIEDAAGFASLGQDRFALSVSAGRVVAPQGGAVSVAGSTLVIPDLAEKPARLDIDLRTDSTVTAALSLLSQPPLRLMDRANLPVTLADGRAAVRAAIGLPIRDGVRGPDVSYEATAVLTRIGSDVLVPNRRLTSSRLEAEIGPDGLILTGPASLDGVALRGVYRQGFGPSGARPQITADVTITPGALQTFGIGLPPGAVRGRGLARIDLTLPRDSPPRLRLTSDLAGVGLSVPAINWIKPEATSGSLALTATLGASPQVEDISLEAPGLRATGTVSLAQGQLQAARFDRVRVGNWFDGPVTLTGRGAGRAVGVTISGGVLDLSRAQLGGGSGGGQGGPIDVTLNRLDIAGGLALTGFRGRFDTTGGLTGRFDGQFNGQAPVTGEVTPTGGRTAVRIAATDAGAVLRAGGFMQGALGGNLDLTLVPAPERRAYDGTLAIRDLRVRDAPGVAALLDAISVVGLLQQLDGQGLSFDTVDAAFRLTPDAITVTQSSAVGPGLGISLDGIYTLASKQVAFQGVVSPFYILNGIGSFLTRRGEGLIGFNFNLAGTAAAPQVTVNPLSLFTPGMFREIFRRPPPQVSR
ncbi:hypothetical protein AN189_10070 [Loktanella sp. 3ANDIMAR09]|uniref:YhdP family protein n=1 Tax=Loktanella sp. 3ANDIMAR09 TaxID=1225657 RepID=UPI000707E3CB|nr:DUF3971 domain-containing protein [Loktanella sp. 3ANDIMAR09]KQI68632.1 hypothetical protein AN189_10070 [Loktanella sp. 3ANDIMAR09]